MKMLWEVVVIFSVAGRPSSFECYVWVGWCVHTQINGLKEGRRVREESPTTRGLSRNVVDEEFQQLLVPFLVRGYVS